MKSLVFLCACSLLVNMCGLAWAAESQGPLDFKVKSIKGDEIDLGKYKGKVVLIVNVASKCGNTPQYKTLETLYEKYHDQGLEILGFPANEFGKQEPGSDEQILEFCTSTYHVTFPMFSKVVVKGEGICPLYQNLTGKDTNQIAPGEITWNFEKFLVGRDGQVAKRFTPKTKPDTPDVVAAIEAALAQK